MYIDPNYVIYNKYFLEPRIDAKIERNPHGICMLNNTRFTTIIPLEKTMPNLTWPKTKSEANQISDLIRSQNTTIIGFLESQIS